ncbi:MAG: DUF4252 domain-containing protein [Bacteroidales bacterium]|nr:DUF4252 domain-containing protein [Bacteroidales bacterium]
MRIFTFIILTVFALTAFAQRSPVEKFIKKNAFEDGISIKEIDPGSTEMSEKIQEEGEEVKEILAQFETIKIISCDAELTSAKTREKFYTKATEALSDDRYAELALVHSEDETFSLYANQKSNGLIEEFVLLVKESNEVMMLYVKGEIDLAFLGMNDFLSSFMKSKGSRNCGGNESSGE